MTELKGNISICTLCGKRVNDDKETKWDEYAEPYCKRCFMKVKK